MKNQTESRIYVASLSAYNAGILHGVWIDLNGKDESEVWNEIKSMLAACPTGEAEEHAIHDFELGKIRISEYESISTILKIVELLEKHGEAFEIAYSHFSDLDEAEEAVKENHQGVFKSIEDWAESFADETGLLSAVPENLRGYFDFEKYANDLEMGGDIWSEGGSEGVHVFWSR